MIWEILIIKQRHADGVLLPKPCYMRLTIRIIIVSLLFPVFTSFNYGVSSATLEWKSESGRTIFNAEIEDLVNLENAEFSIDPVRSSFSMLKDE